MVLVMEIDDGDGDLVVVEGSHEAKDDAGNREQVEHCVEQLRIVMMVMMLAMVLILTAIVMILMAMLL